MRLQVESTTASDTSVREIEVVEGLRQRGIADGHALEEVERRAAVVQPDDDDGHAVVSLRLRAREGRIGGVEGGSEELPGLVEAPGPDEVQHPRIEGGSPIGAGGSTALGEQVGAGLGEQPGEGVDVVVDLLGQLVAEPGRRAPGCARRWTR